MSDLQLMFYGRTDNYNRQSQMCMVLTGADVDVPGDWCQFAATHDVAIERGGDGWNDYLHTYACAVHIDGIRTLREYSGDQAMRGAS